VITLSVSSELFFLAVKLVKIGLHIKLGHEFLRNCVIVYIEREIAEKISVEEIIQTFNIHARKAEFKLTDM
jgi:hypothetical protein